MRISDWSSDVFSSDLRRVFLNRLGRLPHVVITELRYTLSRWLEKNLVAVLEFDDDLGWTVYDHVIDGILSSGADATSSGLGEVHQGGKVLQRSRRTFEHAINGPVGMCAEALFNALTEKKEAGSILQC